MNVCSPGGRKHPYAVCTASSNGDRVQVDLLSDHLQRENSVSRLRELERSIDADVAFSDDLFSQDSCLLDNVLVGL